jgi:hypothetical protein
MARKAKENRCFFLAAILALAALSVKAARAMGSYVLGELKSAGATMSFQLFGGVLSSPWRAMKSAKTCTP